MTLLRRLSLFVLAALALAACGGETATSADLEFSDVWTRQPAAGQSVAAVYGVVTNTGGSDVTITGASVDVTERTELHETLMDDGLMTMQEREDGFVVPAGGSFTFEPGGPHVMLFDIDPATYPAEVLDVTFSFDEGVDTFVSAQVRAIDGEMDGMDHSEMDDMDHSEMDGMDHSEMDGMDHSG